MNKYKGKIVPSFWWDFRGKNADELIIESDIDDYPVVTSTPIKGEQADKEIEWAEKLISDLKAGRITMKQAMRKKFEEVEV